MEVFHNQIFFLLILFLLSTLSWIQTNLILILFVQLLKHFMRTKAFDTYIFSFSCTNCFPIEKSISLAGKLLDNASPSICALLKNALYLDILIFIPPIVKQ